MSCSISPDPISVAISSPPPVLPSPPSCAFRDDQYSHMHASIWKRANYHCLDALLDLGFDRFVICSRSMIAAMDIIAVTKDVRELSTELGIDWFLPRSNPKGDPFQVPIPKTYGTIAKLDQRNRTPESKVFDIDHKLIDPFEAEHATKQSSLFVTESDIDELSTRERRRKANLRSWW